MLEELFAAADNIKARVESEVGKEDPSVQVSALSRFEERFAAFRVSLEEVLTPPAPEE